MLPLLNLLFHAFLYIHFAFPDLHNMFADVISSQSFNLDWTFIPFLRLGLIIVDWLAWWFSWLSNTESFSYEAFKSWISCLFCSDNTEVRTVVLSKSSILYLFCCCDVWVETSTLSRIAYWILPSELDSSDIMLFCPRSTLFLCLLCCLYVFFFSVCYGSFKW